MKKFDNIQAGKMIKLTKQQIEKISGGSGGSGAVILVPDPLLVYSENTVNPFEWPLALRPGNTQFLF